MPKASRDRSLGTFAENMSLRSRRLSVGMKSCVERSVFAPTRMARVRVQARTLPGTSRRCDGTKLRMNLDTARKTQRNSNDLRGNKKEEGKADHGSTSSVEGTNANRPMDLTPGNAALLVVSTVAATRSGTEAAKTKSSLSAFTPAGSMAASIPPVASHRGRSQ
jgi:hypothetical protein